jgi:hypothetical protein
MYRNEGEPQQVDKGLLHGISEDKYSEDEEIVQGTGFETKLRNADTWTEKTMKLLGFRKTKM